MNETLTKNKFKTMTNPKLADTLARLVWDNLDAGSVESDLIEEITRRILFNIQITTEEPGQVVCLDMDCEVREYCEHADPHPKNGECQFVCEAELPCAVCQPVEACHD